MAITHFSPKRPIFLSENNTSFKTKVEVEFAIEKLRSKGWLCTYNEKTLPILRSFDDIKEYNKFLKDCDAAKVEIKEPDKKIELEEFGSIERLFDKNVTGLKVEGAEELESVSSVIIPEGLVQVEE